MKSLASVALWTVLLLLFTVCSDGRRHHLEVRDDIRRYIPLSTFGFYPGGILDVKLSNFLVIPHSEYNIYGLSLDKTLSDAMNPYLDTHQDNCILQEPISSLRSGPILFFIMDLRREVVYLNCSSEWQNTHIYKDASHIPPMRGKRQSFATVSDSKSMYMQRRKRAVNDLVSVCRNYNLTLTCTKNDLPFKVCSFTFAMEVSNKADEGLYNLYFHSCPNYDMATYYSLQFDVDIEEKNGQNYLSAGEMPLPALYFMMSLLFFLSGLFWVFILKKSKHPVFKIHYLMAVLVFLKSLSLLFHGINYHFIQTKGEHVEAWAILYYITHLLKGAVLFITIVLIGTGWTFIKHILADKDKKLFMIVIPLQVLANVAEIIIAESEEGFQSFIQDQIT
ncbi:hypothetical protein RP20_CCG010060 [Aedes albopictus]|nr:hypothetical protein RP20_CCG010060 [Aedes albopictus]